MVFYFQKTTSKQVHSHIIIEQLFTWIDQIRVAGPTGFNILDFSDLLVEFVERGVIYRW